MSQCKWFVLRASSAMVALVAAVLILGSCGGGSTTTTSSPPSTTGTVTTNVSDPPTCAAPAGPFSHVWVTITKVMAHTSSDTSISPTASGWITLVDATSTPKQLDLLSLAQTTCALTQLGLTSGLPPGTYQQIRLLLLSNSPASGTATPSTNNCSAAGSSVFNCVVTSSGTTALQLASEAQTGIKIAPGQITGGAITLTAGQAANINIDFNSCASIVKLGNGGFLLKPVLTAGVVSTAVAITGTFVDSSTKNGIQNAIALLEQTPSGSSSEQILQAAVADSSGNFSFCPVPSGNFDVVGAAELFGTVTKTYNATVTFSVPAGTALGNIPLVAEMGASTMPATLSGQVTTAGSSGAVSTTVSFFPFQAATKGTTTVQVIIPALGAMQQPASLMTASGNACTTGTDCATYTLPVPASNPQFGTFSSSGTTYTAPAVPPVNYTLTATSPTCTSSATSSTPITVVAGTTTTPTPNPLALTGCTAP